jgi:hypothetical protein
MTHESIPAPAASRAAPGSGRRPNADYRWTPRKAIAFLDLLAAGESVAAAARVVGGSRQSAYRLRERVGGRFAQGWDLAQRAGHVRRAAARERLGGGAR